MRIVAVASSKGGVGKTTLAVHLAVGLAGTGRKVVLVDLDPGGHATTWLLGDRYPTGIAEALVSEDERLAPEQLVPIEGRPKLYLVPASPRLKTVDSEIRSFGRETILRTVLRKLSKIDVVVIDCPPEDGFLSSSAVYAADGVIVPVLPGYLGLSGLVDVQTLIDQVRKRGRARVTLLGAVVFGADDRETTPDEARAGIRRLAPDALYTSEIRYSRAAKSLPAYRTTAWDPGADARGAEDYRAVLSETETRLEGP